MLQNDISYIKNTSYFVSFARRDASMWGRLVLERDIGLKVISTFYLGLRSHCCEVNPIKRSNNKIVKESIHNRFLLANNLLLLL